MVERLSHPTGFLRLKEVLIIFPVSRSTWYRGIEVGRYPAPVKIGRMSFWRLKDIQELCDWFAGISPIFPTLLADNENQVQLPLLDQDFDS